MVGDRPQAVTFAVNEIETLGAKAARGAGAPPAQATRFGKALVHHLAQKRDLESLYAALSALPKGSILTCALAPDDTPLGQSYTDAQNKPAPARLTLPESLKDHLHTLAQNTYLPATTASRSVGAGAGLTDND